MIMPTNLYRTCEFCKERYVAGYLDCMHELSPFSPTHECEEKKKWDKEMNDEHLKGEQDHDN